MAHGKKVLRISICSAGFGVLGLLASMVPVLAGQATAKVQGMGQAGPALVKSCQFAAGKVVWCGQPYTGQAVLAVPAQGAWGQTPGKSGPQQGHAQPTQSVQQCHIAHGQPVLCTGPYTGTAVVKAPNGFYAACTISAGNITFCTNPYTGQAVTASQPGGML